MAHQLTGEQRQFYDENGYLVVPGLFDASELALYRQRFSDIVSGAVEAAPEMLLMRDVMVAKGAVAAQSDEAATAKVQDFHNDPVLYPAYSTCAKLLDWVEAFVGPDIKTIHSMLINKPPNVDGRHPLHQDLLYFPFRPADQIVASWTAIDPCTRENGCLVVVPGSHKGELLPHENPDWEFVNFAYFGAKGVGSHPERVHLEMNPGDTVFFHPVLLHGSGQNRTQDYRKAISCHYASAACQFLPGAKPVGQMRPYVLVRGSEHAGGI